MVTVFWLAVGALAAAGLLAHLRRQGSLATQRALALGLGIAAAIYVAFALGHAEPPWLAVEAAGAALFGTLAWVCVRARAAWLAAGWVAHAGWDALHLLPALDGAAPAGYALACFSFDLVVGGYLLGAYRSGAM